MKRWAFRSVVAVLLLAGLYGAWTWFFPSAEKVIRQKILQLARDASFAGNEGPLAQVNNASNVTGYFTPDLKVVLEVPGQPRQVFAGREEMFRAAMAARTALPSLNVEFPDVVVLLGADKTTASVNVTARARLGGDRESVVQELRFAMKKVGGKWLINRVETVKTLTLAKSAGCSLARVAGRAPCLVLAAPV